MNLKKIKILAVIGIFILSFLSHFAYEIFPNIIFSFIFPVNESIWEHMKILFTSTLLYGIIDYLLLKKYNIKYVPIGYIKCSRLFPLSDKISKKNKNSHKNHLN